VLVLEQAARDEGGQSRYTDAYLRMKSHTEVPDDFETQIADNSQDYAPNLMRETARPVNERAPFATALSMV
jgi:tricarballylate dehydrogenase